MSLPHRTVALALGCILCLGAAQSRAATLARVSRSDCERLLADDDRGRDTLRIALRRTAALHARLSNQETYPVVDRPISQNRLAATTAALQRALDDPAGIRAACSTLHVYRVRSPEVLVTGYYQPVLRARLARTDTFRHPLYGLPPQPERYTRDEIDGGALEGRAPVLAWLDDPVEVFFLQIQGSGVLETPQRRMYVGYAGSNDLPYTSIGRLLIKEGRLTREQVSMQSLKAWLHAHPAERDRVLHHNERYVFFTERDAGPVGSQGIVLVPGRSVAADPEVYAPGLPLLLRQRSDPSDVRLTVVHDAGDAIRGPGRLDLFVGTGGEAGAIAGRMGHRVDVFVLLAEKQ